MAGVEIDERWCDLLPPADQLRGAWGRRVAVWPGRPGVRELLTTADVDSIVADGRARHPQVAVLVRGLPAPLSDYTTGRSINGVTVPGFVDPVAIRRILADGGSVHLNDLQTYHRGIGRLCAVLTARTGLHFAAMAFLSPPGRSGFVVHRDPLHVLVLQTAGTKTWEVYQAQPAIRSGPVDEAALGAAAQRVTLRTGDLMYVPPGLPHRATSDADWSLHLSVVTAPLSTRRTVGSVLAGLLGDPAAELPVGWFDTLDDAARALHDLSDKVAAGLRATDWHEVARSEVARSEAALPGEPAPGTGACS